MQSGLGVGDFVGLLNAMRQSGFGQWTRYEIESALSSLGWSLACPIDDSPNYAVSQWLTLSAPEPLRDAYLGTGRRLEFNEITVIVAESVSVDEFRQFESATAEVFDAGPHAWGGPGPFLRWRDPDDGERSFALALEGADLRLSVYATADYESFWHKSIEYSVGSMEWIALSPRFSEWTMPGGPIATDWKFSADGKLIDFEEKLSQMLAVLAHDLRVLDDGASVVLCAANDPNRYIRFLIDEDDATILVEASSETGLRPTDTRMRALGWYDRARIEPTNWWRAFDGLDTGDCASAAHLIVTTLKAYGLEPKGDQSMDHLMYRPNYVSRTRPANWTQIWGIHLPHY